MANEQGDFDEGPDAGTVGGRGAGVFTGEDKEGPWCCQGDELVVVKWELQIADGWAKVPRGVPVGGAETGSSLTGHAGTVQFKWGL